MNRKRRGGEGGAGRICTHKFMHTGHERLLATLWAAGQAAAGAPTGRRPARRWLTVLRKVSHAVSCFTAMLLHSACHDAHSRSRRRQRRDTRHADVSLRAGRQAGRQVVCQRAGMCKLAPLASWRYALRAALQSDLVCCWTPPCYPLLPPCCPLLCSPLLTGFAARASRRGRPTLAAASPAGCCLAG